jgi:hypothetical protein
LANGIRAPEDEAVAVAVALEFHRRVECRPALGRAQPADVTARVAQRDVAQVAQAEAAAAFVVRAAVAPGTVVVGAQDVSRIAPVTLTVDRGRCEPLRVTTA